MRKFSLLAAIPAGLLFLYSYSYFGSALNLGQGFSFRLRGEFAKGFLGLLFSPARGLFVFSPIFILSLPYIPKIFSKNEEKITKYLLVCLALTVLAYSKWGMWWGGHSFGYRIIMECIPILMIFLVKSWMEIISKNKFLIILFFVLTAVSLYFNFLGARIYPCAFNYSPNDIDRHTERLWQVKGTELLRCSNNFISPIIYKLFPK